MTPRRQRVMSPQTRQALARGRGRPPHGPRVETGRRLTHPAGPPGGGTGGLAGSPSVAVALRAQRRLATRTMAVLLGALLLLPLLLAVLPALDVGESWALLGVAAYPLLLGLAVRHRRATDRLESEIERRANRVGG
jgi:hypothetical protein